MANIKNIKKVVKAARRGYQKFASNKDTIKATRIAEKALMTAARASGDKKMAHLAGAGIGLVKAVGGHDARTRSKGKGEVIRHGVPLAVSAIKAAATGGAMS